MIILVIAGQGIGGYANLRVLMSVEGSIVAWAKCVSATQSNHLPIPLPNIPIPLRPAFLMVAMHLSQLADRLLMAPMDAVQFVKSFPIALLTITPRHILTPLPATATSTRRRIVIRPLAYTATNISINTSTSTRLRPPLSITL